MALDSDDVLIIIGSDTVVNALYLTTHATLACGYHMLSSDALQETGYAKYALLSLASWSCTGHKSIAEAEVIR